MFIDVQLVSDTDWKDKVPTRTQSRTGASLVHRVGGGGLD